MGNLESPRYTYYTIKKYNIYTSQWEYRIEEKVIRG